VQTTRRASLLKTEWLLAALAAVVGAGLVGLIVGPVSLGTTAILKEMTNLLPGIEIASGLSDVHAGILLDVRLPRLVLGLLVGATLALSGGSYQGVFRNPLASPWLLGVAAGAGLGATIAIVVGSGQLLTVLPLAAFVGALLGVSLTYLMGYSSSGRTSLTLVLSGIAVSSFLTAGQTFLQMQHSELLRDVFSWILGGLTTASWREVLLILPYLTVSIVTMLLYARRLDVMSVGDDEAESLGINVARTRLVVIAAASLGTAAVVAVSGLIGFVGIIVPHAVRLVAGASYRVILPLSFLFGGAFLVLTDVLAKTIVSPNELPLGVITAFIGAPFFGLILHRSKAVAP
jgi:iron complex transport system permease protein